MHLGCEPCCVAVIFVFFNQKTAYEMRISDWSSYVCSSDLCASNSWTAYTAGLISVLVMAGLLGDVEHHQPAMTASLLKRFCRTSRTLPDRDDQRDGKLSVDTARRPGEEGHRHEGSVAKIVKLEHAWRRLDGRNDDGFQVAPFPG